MTTVQRCMGTKQWKYSQRLLALHEEWAVKNGYRDKPQATSDMLNVENSERFVKGAKRQATSGKLQAPSDKLQASNGTSSNKR